MVAKVRKHFQRIVRLVLQCIQWHKIAPHHQSLHRNDYGRHSDEKQLIIPFMPTNFMGKN